MIIQDCISWQVIGENAHWLPNRDEALRFSSPAKAVEYCRQHKIENYTLRIVFDDPDDARPQKTPTLFTLLTFYDSAYALNAFCNSLACAA